MKFGNFLGLPINFVVFSLVVVITAAATVPVYGQLITDPVETIAQLDNTFAIAFGALTLTTATIGINIVANFIAPAFDFSNIAPSKISWRTGGMIAAVGSVFLTPWNLYNSPEVIHYTLDTLASFIGPLFGVLIAFFYVIHKHPVNVDALFSSAEDADYYYNKGFNTNAVIAVCVGAALCLAVLLIPALSPAATYNWFIGAIVAGVLTVVLEKMNPIATAEPATAQAPITTEDAKPEALSVGAV